MWRHRRWRIVVLGSAAWLLGCGERTPRDDGRCGPDKPKAYAKAPWFASCDQVRTNEAVLDSSGKVVEDNIHRHIRCCR